MVTGCFSYKKMIAISWC